jgi:hypothetical protein
MTLVLQPENRARANYPRESDYIISDKGPRPHNGVIHKHALDDRTPVTDHTLRSNKGAGLNFCVAVSDSIVPDDGGAPDDCLATNNQASSNVDRPTRAAPSSTTPRMLWEESVACS